MPKMTLSKSAINEAIIAFEVGWDKSSGFAYYNRKFCKPTVPDPANTSSGVTIGIGYDCGYYTAAQIRKDWSSLLQPAHVEQLAACAGLKKFAAADRAKQLQHIVVPIDAALNVFYNSTLPKFAKATFSIYPAIVNIHPVEQTVFVGLIYNRGNDLSGDRRREMRQLVDAIKRDNDGEMANLVRSMKRLWANTRGLRIRRDVEAAMIERADSPLPQEDLLLIEF